MSMLASAVIWCTTTRARRPALRADRGRVQAVGQHRLRAELADERGLGRGTGHPDHLVPAVGQHRDELLSERPLAPATKIFMVCSFVPLDGL
jgi:hypothetical protein